MGGMQATTKPASVTFSVSPVERGRETLSFDEDVEIPALKKRKIEAEGSNALAVMRTSGHGLVVAMHAAYAEHYPLVLSPDIIWLAIAQGFAQHVLQNAERLRGKFVRHEGKLLLEVRRDAFVRGSRDNDWPGVFGEFSDAIAKHIGKQRDLVVANFSTTGPIERAASEIVLLDAMQNYFDFSLVTLCGIPEVTIEGTADDWRTIRRRVVALDEYELSWWTKLLLPIVDEFVSVVERKPPNVQFWQRMFKLEGGSGGPFVSGWINALFPYVEDHDGRTFRGNEYMELWRKEPEDDDAHGLAAHSIPCGLSKAPFQWNYLGHILAMEFWGGFTGITQDPVTLAVRPAIGWVVCEEPGVATNDPQLIAATQWFAEWQASHDRGPFLRGIGWRAHGEFSAQDLMKLQDRISRAGTRAGVEMKCVPLIRVENPLALIGQRFPYEIVVGVFFATASEDEAPSLTESDIGKFMQQLTDLEPRVRELLSYCPKAICDKKMDGHIVRKPQ